MIADLPVCEWNPGANRSVVSIEVAAQRVHPADRTLLIAKFNQRAFDDRVTITRNAVQSDTGAAQYAATLANMNFAKGRICKAITRKGPTWVAGRRAGAVVLWVGDRAYGWAADCGNLFELTRLPAPPAPPALLPPQVFVAEPVLPAVPPSEPEAPTFHTLSAPNTGEPGDVLPPPAAWAGPGAPFAVFPGPGVLLPPLAPPGGAVAPVPEPPTWAALGLGLVALAWWRRRR
jgi:hypothetical protein